MKNSSSRILTTHVGSLARPQEIIDVMRAKESGQPYDAGQFASLIRYSVQRVVRRQCETGIDVPSDGEYAKSSFSNYVHDRLTGFEPDLDAPEEQSVRNAYRDRQQFLDFYQQYDRDIGGASVGTVVCTSPITYRGQDLVQQDIDNLKGALQRFSPEEAFIPAVAPGTIELQRSNRYYNTQEEFLTAIAEAMREEYRAIVDAGFILQVDDPRVVTQYGVPDPAPTVEEYRKFATMRVDASTTRSKDYPRTVFATTCAGVAGMGPTPPMFPCETSWTSSCGSMPGPTAWSRQPAPRPRVGGLGVHQAARRQVPHTRRHRPHHQPCGAPGTGGPAPRQLRPHCGARKRPGRQRLRLLARGLHSPRAPFHHVG